MRGGILGAISKRARAQQEAEAAKRLSAAETELASVVDSFTAEQERLRDEYERRKKPVIEQIQYHQKEIEKQEIDGSLETRRAACEAFVNAVNALLRRNNVLHSTMGF